jgi:ATP-dependent DNA helicase RecG
MLQSFSKIVSPWLDTSQLHDVSDLIARDEGQVLDFKSARIEPRDLAEVLVAFANSDGGTVVIGVENDKTKGEGRSTISFKCYMTCSRLWYD